MSEIYIQRMRAIRDDLDIAREAFAYIHANWHTQKVADAFKSRTQARIERAEANLEVTYFVRLTAEFEGILKDHLRTNHPETAFPVNRRDWALDWFLRRILQKEGLKLDAELRRKLDEVRDFRNILAHGNTPGYVVTFTQALARYSTFLAKLPEPRS